MKLIKEEIIKNNKWDGLIQKFHLEIPLMKNREKNIALLRYAYLYAFSLFGYALIFGPTKLINPHYEIIRRQILKPEEEIITFVPVIKNNNPPSEGLFIITHPEEMKSIMVTLSLTRNKITDYYSVFLPAPDNRGFRAYDFYQYNNINRIEKLNLKLAHVKNIDIGITRKNAVALYNFMECLEWYGKECVICWNLS